MANSLLQSGASIGAIFTPQLVALLYVYDPAQWRWSLYIVAGLAVPWVIAWLWMVRDADVKRPVIQTDEVAAGAGEDRVLEERPLWRIFMSRRWWLLLVVVSCINVVWHYIRVWLPLWLEQERGYSHQFVQHFTSIYYLATFLGAMTAGSATAALSRGGWNVHRSRMTVFLVCAVLSAAIVPAAFLPQGWLLLGALLLVGFGSLGLFPIYYSLNQELSAKHQGKVGGTLGFSTWVLLYFFQGWVGRVLTEQPDLKPAIVTVVGLGPLVRLGVVDAVLGPARRALIYCRQWRETISRMAVQVAVGASRWVLAMGTGSPRQVVTVPPASSRITSRRRSPTGRLILEEAAVESAGDVAQIGAAVPNRRTP
jgi:ACS family hexuronate transporter-like MFS transporter